MTAPAASGLEHRLLRAMSAPIGEPTLEAHTEAHGPLRFSSPGDPGAASRLVDLMARAGLAGRGGGGFPTWAKVTSAAAENRAPLVVLNAVESEPASYKDTALMTNAPHLALDGAEHVARALGAVGVRVCISLARPHTAEVVRTAVAERQAKSLCAVPIEVIEVPNRYVAGEESALVRWLGGGEPLPAFRPDRGVPMRLGKAPVLVHNAETLAHLALIVRHGPDWFRSVGTPDAPGTVLLTVTGAVRHPGVYEVPFGIRLHTVLDDALITHELGAMLLGGYGGTWLAPNTLGTELTPAALASIGANLGPGVMIAVPASACVLAETARIVQWMADERARQCGPCTFGLPAVAGDLASLAFADTSLHVLDRLWARLATIDGRGACRHPDGVVRLVRSALRSFPDHVDQHCAHGPCPAATAQTSLRLPPRSEEARQR
jgi:NADH:ubiquinone oxidoreductase subunit F (NADH-binding)